MNGNTPLLGPKHVQLYLSSTVQVLCCCLPNLENWRIYFVHHTTLFLIETSLYNYTAG